MRVKQHQSSAELYDFRPWKLNGSRLKKTGPFGDNRTSLIIKEARGALECNLIGRCPFFKNLYNPFKKRFAFGYPVSELLDYKIFQKQ